MENSNIEWTDHTFNPWTGCTKVSPGCAHCYAESWAKRSGTVQWGPGKPRRRTKTWGDPVKWNREAEATQLDLTQRQKISDPRNEQPEIWKARRPRVFSASLADWLDDEVPIEWLADFLKLIHATPNLDWLLLTKRPENWSRRVSLAAGELAESWIDCIDMPERGAIPENIWLGTTVENQEMADLRIPILLQIPAKVRFLSCEPLLGPVDLMEWIGPAVPAGIAHHHRTGHDGGFGGDYECDECDFVKDDGAPQSIHWVIAGGESGPGARPMHPDWPRTLRDQCAAASVPFLFKQWGEWAPCPIDSDKPNLVTDAVFKRGPGHDGQVWKIGKKAAGRHLDGQLHSEFPTP